MNFSKGKNLDLSYSKMWKYWVGHGLPDLPGPRPLWLILSIHDLFILILKYKAVAPICKCKSNYVQFYISVLVKIFWPWAKYFGKARNISNISAPPKLFCCCVFVYTQKYMTNQGPRNNFNFGRSVLDEFFKRTKFGSFI